MGLFLIFHLNEAGLWLPPHDTQLILLSITFLVTFILPLFTALFLLRTKQINSLEMQSKEERRIPYLTTAVFYFCESYFFMRIDIPALVQAFMLGATILVVSTLVINIFWKISAHMVGIGGICGMMIAISYRLQMDIHFTLITLFLIAGLAAFSRLRLTAHAPAQVYSGFLLGILVQLVLFL
jgi:hypothetical protein